MSIRTEVLMWCDLENDLAILIEVDQAGLQVSRECGACGEQVSEREVAA